MKKDKWSRVKCKNSGKRWTEEDKCRLETLWGKKSVKAIGNALGRSEASIKGMVRKLELGAFFDNGYYTAKEVGDLLKVHKSTVLIWIKEKGLRAIKRKKLSKHMYQITLEDLYDWLKLNQDLWNASKLEYMTLGKEEEWLELKRRNDSNFKKKCIPYQPKEDRLVKRMYLNGCSNREISEKTGRSIDSVKKRVSYLRKKYKLPFRYVAIQEERRAS